MYSKKDILALSMLYFSTESPEKLRTQNTIPQVRSQLLSLPLEIQMQVNALLVYPSGKIDLLYEYNLSNEPRHRFKEQMEHWIHPNIYFFEQANS